jgi:hypothetical protein
MIINRYTTSEITHFMLEAVDALVTAEFEMLSSTKNAFDKDARLIFSTQSNIT